MDEVKVNVTATGNELIFREGDAAPIYNYQGFRYLAESNQSFIDLVKNKANKPAAVIAYNEHMVQAILDDTIKDRRQDTVKYEYRFSQQLQEWSRILNQGYTFNQKEFIDFVRRREEGEILEAEMLLMALKNFKYETIITGDFTYEDNNNYTCMVKIGDSEATVSIPKFIYPTIEIYNESGFKQVMEIEIEVIKPKSNEEKVHFKLSCPKYKRYEKEALDNEIQKIKEGLEGYLIVAGDIFNR
jgi:hypothetical protein